MESLRAVRTKVEEQLIAEAQKSALANDNKSPLRVQGLRQFEALGLPHRRIEEWKYTDLRAAWREPLPVAQRPDPALIDAAARLAPLPELPGLSFVNGTLTAVKNLPENIEALPLEEANGGLPATIYEGWKGPALALNTAFLNPGAVLRVKKGAKFDQPLHLDLRHVGSSASYPRIIVVLEEDAECVLLETHVSPDETYACNGVISFVCSKNARLKHVRAQTQGKKTINILSTVAELDANAQFSSFALEEGAALSRNQYFIRQIGENAQISLSGVSLARNEQHLDTTLYVDHAVPHGLSRELFRQVITDKARGVFQGKIIVRPNAQKTDGHMNARGLLLSEHAEFDAKPELEIYADDVLCAHGATAGALDENQLFYFRARGIPEPEAKALLTLAFVGEAVDKIEFEPLRAAIMQRCAVWLSESL